MQSDTPINGRSLNLYYYIAEVHPTVIHRCTTSSDSTLYNLLENLISSALCFIIIDHVIINESLRRDYSFPYIANHIVSSRTLLKTVLYQSIWWTHSYSIGCLNKSSYVDHSWETQDLNKQNNLIDRTQSIQWKNAETCPFSMIRWKLGKLQQKYTQKLTFRKNSFQKLTPFSFIFKLWRSVVFSIQNLTRCMFYFSEHGMMFFSQFNIWRHVFFKFKFWQLGKNVVQYPALRKSTKDAE